MKNLGFCLGLLGLGACGGGVSEISSASSPLPSLGLSGSVFFSLARDVLVTVGPEGNLIGVKQQSAATTVTIVDAENIIVRYAGTEIPMKFNSATSLFEDQTSSFRLRMGAVGEGNHTILAVVSSNPLFASSFNVQIAPYGSYTDESTLTNLASATYTGEAFLRVVGNGGSETSTGTAIIQADFTNSSVSGEFAMNASTSSNMTPSIGAFSQTFTGGTISGNKLSIPVAFDDAFLGRIGVMPADLVGGFFGPNGEEAAGGFLTSAHEIYTDGMPGHHNVVLGGFVASR